MSKKRQSRQIGRPGKANSVDKISVEKDVDQPQSLDDPIVPLGSRENIVVRKECSFYRPPQQNLWVISGSGRSPKAWYKAVSVAL